MPDMAFEIDPDPNLELGPDLDLGADFGANPEDLPDPFPNEGWPRERVPKRDTRVIGAVHGAYHAVMLRLALSTRDYGLDAAEALVLQAILRNPGCAPWEIRREVGLLRSTLSSILDRLELAGLIHRRRSDFDRRRFEIWTTPAGTSAGVIAEAIMKDVEAEIASYTSPAERHGARAVFEAAMAIGHRERGVTD